YPRGDNIFERLTELGQVSGGFDWWVDDGRQLRLAATKGDDLSDQVSLDLRSITKPGLHVAVSAAGVASVAFASNSAELPPVQHEAVNSALAASFGRVGVAEQFDGVVEQATINAHANRMLGVRNGPQVAAMPEAIPVAGASVTDFASGDWVEMAFDPGVGLVVFRRRVLAKRVTVSEDGNETIGVEFV